MNDDPVYPLSGDLTIYQVQAVRDELRQAWDAGSRQFDATGLSSLDSAGAQLLASLHKTAQQQEQPIRWVGWSAAAQDTLNLLGLKQLLA